MHNHSFGEHYGVLIASTADPAVVPARSSSWMPRTTIKHVEIVPEIASEPNYGAALGVLWNVVHEHVSV